METAGGMTVGKRLIKYEQPDDGGWLVLTFDDGTQLQIRTDDAILVVHSQRQ